LLPISPESAREIDEAAEFAALEGASIAQALSGLPCLRLPATHHPQLRQHAEDVARLARELAPLAGVDPEMAHTAGLVHDAGRSVLNRAAIGRWVEGGFPLVYAETLACGEDHASAGAELLRACGLPEEIVEAVRYHHRPEASVSRLAAVLALAEDAAARISHEPFEDLWPDMRRLAACRTAGIDPSVYEQFCCGRSAFALKCA
jgi:putative nucleotidyltransferase with HDIG domain